MDASARDDRPGLLVPRCITTHDLKTIERIVDLGMYLSVAVSSTFHVVGELRG